VSAERFKYRAFISYSHSDTAVATWLHKALESYRIPQRLVGRETSTGIIGKKVGTIFRDRDELPVAADLSGQINEALAATQFLIVLCSTKSAQSKWVNQEIINFKRLKGAASIIAVIVDGEPYAGSKPGHEAQECFPPALKYHVTPDGALTDQPAEPIAADLRPDKDPKRLVRMKVLAGLLGVGLDELIRRDNARRQKLTTYALAASVALMGVMGALTFNAIEARNEAEIAQDNAERRRGQAEELIEFMLTDLKRPLMEVGRLKEYNDVAVRATRYYQGENLADQSANSLGRRARAMHLLGEAKFREGDITLAKDIFSDVYATTEKLLHLDLETDNRLYEHGQSAFWLGRILMEIGLYDQAEAKFREYVDLSVRYLEFDATSLPRNADIARSRNSLGVALVRAGKANAALSEFSSAREKWSNLLDAHPDDDGMKTEYANTLSWIGVAYEALGDIEMAIATHSLAKSLYFELRSKYEEEKDLDSRLVNAHRELGWLELRAGRPVGSELALNVGLSLSTKMLARDPGNMRWKIQAASLRLLSANLMFLASDYEKSKRVLTDPIFDEVEKQLELGSRWDLVFETAVERELMLADIDFRLNNLDAYARNTRPGLALLVGRIGSSEDSPMFAITIAQAIAASLDRNRQFAARGMPELSSAASNLLVKFNLQDTNKGKLLLERLSQETRQLKQSDKLLLGGKGIMN
jgi:tetratricopeptide (TPR) repeat protein